MNITIGGIVCDNLRVQKSAIDSVINEYNEVFILVLYNYHYIQLSIKDFFNQSFLHGALRSIKIFAISFNSKLISAHMKFCCPKRCLTRWNNIRYLFFYYF